jgi:oligopeptide transport system substrate-binding protein
LVCRKLDDYAPGQLSLLFLVNTRHATSAVDFVSQMLEHWLIPGRHLFTISSHNTLFRFRGVGRELFLAMELVLAVESERDLVNIRHNLPGLVEEIRLGLRAPSEAHSILEGKGLSGGQKWRSVQESLLQAIQRKPQRFTARILQEYQFLRLHAREGFEGLRSVEHLTRVVKAHYWFRKQIHSSLVQQAEKRHLRVKLFPTSLRFPFGLKPVVGIVVDLNFIKPHELFEAQHILHAVKRLIDDAEIVPASFVQYRANHDSVRACYVEVQKQSGGAFTPTECRYLAEQLPDLLAGSVETLVRSVFMQRNEEEVFQNILRLSRELKYVGDIPQVFVSYCGQNEEQLTFNVILARILKGDSLKVEEILADAPEGLEVHCEQERIVGMLRKRYRKEAYVFSVHMDKAAFFRRDHSIDLYRARKRVVSFLSERFGAVRDYNGGLMLKQGELLSAVRQLLCDEPLNDDFLLENFFYSLTPVVMQTLLQPEQVKTLFLLLLESLDAASDSRQRYQMRVRDEDTCLFIMLSSSDSSFLTPLYAYFDSVNLSCPNLAYSHVDSNGTHTLGIIYRNADAGGREDFRAEISQVVEAWSKQAVCRRVLRLNWSGHDPVLDPRMGKSGVSGVLIHMLYEGLTRVAPSGRPEFALAQAVTISSDLRTYTFTLRQARWSNGMPITAHDFEYAWKKAVDPNSQARFAYMFHVIKGARAASQGVLGLDDVAIRTIDERTLVVELEHPAPYFLELTAHWFYSPLCREVEQMHPGWAHYGEQFYVCNGPFRLAQWDRSRGLRLVKNEHYWDAKTVELEGIELTTVVDPKKAFSMYRNGELDWIGEPICPLPHGEVQALIASGDLKYKEVAASYWYDFNVERAPFTSRKMRRAFTIAINRRKLIDACLFGDESAVSSIIPPSLQLSESEWFKDGDLEEARRLFEEGLEELGVSARELPLVTICYVSHENFSGIAQEIARQWEEAFGIKVLCDAYDSTAYLDYLIHAREFQVGSVNWYSWLSDPIYNLQYLKFRDVGINATNWEHPDYIDLLDQADNSFDCETRLELLRRAEQLLMDEMPVCPLISYNYRYLEKPHVSGVSTTRTGQIDFKWTRLNH